MTNAMSGPAAPDEIDLADLLRGQIGLILTDGQVATLVERHSLAPPVGSWLSTLPPATDADEQELAGMGVIEDGAPSEWFLSLWRTVTAPVFMVSVDRLIDGNVVEWLYTIDVGTYAEQVRTAVGWTWLFGIHEELLARVLLNVGILRFRRDAGETVLDPFPSAASWTGAVTFLGRQVDGAPQVRLMRCAYDGQAWSTVAEDGSTVSSTPAELGEKIAGLLGAGLGERPPG